MKYLSVSIDALPLYEKQAKERQLSTLKKGDEFPVSALMHERGRSDEQIGDLLNVSGRYVSEAKKLKEESPEGKSRVQ